MLPVTSLFCFKWHFKWPPHSRGQPLPLPWSLGCHILIFSPIHCLFSSGTMYHLLLSISHMDLPNRSSTLMTNSPLKCTRFQQISAAAAAKLLQSCPTLCDPIDGSPPGSTVPGILQARTLEWVAISFSNPTDL